MDVPEKPAGPSLPALLETGPLQSGPPLSKAGIAQWVLLVGCALLGCALLAPPAAGQPLPELLAVRPPAAPESRGLEAGHLESEQLTPAARARRRRAVGYELPGLVDDLRDDDVRHNATDAVRLLLDLMYQEPDLVRTALLPHVGSWDAQLRDLSSSLVMELDLLTDFDFAGGEATPPALLRRAVDHLVRPPRFESRFFGLASRRSRVLFAAHHAERIEAELLELIRAAEDQPRRREGQGFLPAFVLAVGGRRSLAPELAPILVHHLADNQLVEDALMSMEALVALGHGVIPSLLEARASSDPQQAACAELVLLELELPADSPELQQQRAHLNRVTWKCAAPSHSWRFRSSYRGIGRGTWRPESGVR